MAVNGRSKSVSDLDGGRRSRRSVWTQSSRLAGIPSSGSGRERDKVERRLDVSAAAPAGCDRLCVDLFVPDGLGPSPLLWVCVPGGGISRQYFDLELWSGQNGAFSMARYLASGGDLVVTVDPPGVGESESPDDGYTLSPHVVADVVAAADPEPSRLTLRPGVWRARTWPRRGAGPRSDWATPPGRCSSPASRPVMAPTMPWHCSASPPRAFPRSSTRKNSSLSNRPEANWPEASRICLESDLVTHSLNGRAAPVANIEPSLATAEVDVALADASSSLLALVGMTAIVPGSVQPSSTNFGFPFSSAWASTILLAS